MFWKKKPPPRPPSEVNGFKVGDVVRHKLDNRRVVLISFWHDDDGVYAHAAHGSLPGQTGEYYLAEIERIEAAQAVDAVDPSAGTQER